MKNGIGTPVSTPTLVHRLRLIADTGGVLTTDRVKTVIEAADRLEDLNERIRILSERIDTSLDNTMFP